MLPAPQYPSCEPSHMALGAVPDAVPKRRSPLRGTSSVCALGLVWGALCLPGSEAHGQTLSEAVRMALSTNPALAAQRASVEALGERRVQATSQRRASLSGEGAVSYSGSWSRGRNPVTGALTSSTYEDSTPASVGLTAAQPIWLAGRVEAALSQAEAQIAQGQAELTAAEIAIMQSVVQAYADLRRDLEGSSIRAQNVQALTRQLEAARARFEVGEITRTDVAQVEARLAAGRTALTLAQARVEASRSAIERLIGQTPADLRPAVRDVAIPASLDQALVLARTNNPEIAAARFGETIARQTAKVIQAENRPRASLQATAGGALDQGFDGNRGGSVGVSARMSIPLYTGGLSSSRVREALGNANAARLSVVDTERQVVERVSNAWRQIGSARAAVQSSTEQVSAARIAFEGAELEQSVGLRTTLDVLIQQQELLEAELAKAAADRDLQVATTGLAAAAGILTPQAFDAAATPARIVAVPRPLWIEEPLVLVQKVLDPIPLPPGLNGPSTVSPD
jgi:outer membrane protein